MSGVDIVLENESVRVDETNVDDIVNLDIGANGYGTIDGEQLPIGDLIVDNLPDDADLSELDADTSDAQDDVRMSLAHHRGRGGRALVRQRVPLRRRDDPRQPVPRRTSPLKG